MATLLSRALSPSYPQLASALDAAGAKGGGGTLKRMLGNAAYFFELRARFCSDARPSLSPTKCDPLEGARRDVADSFAIPASTGVSDTHTHCACCRVVVSLGSPSALAAEVLSTSAAFVVIFIETGPPLASRDSRSQPRRDALMAVPRRHQPHPRRSRDGNGLGCGCGGTNPLRLSRRVR